LLKFQSEVGLGFSLPKKLVERVQSATICGDYLWPFTAESGVNNYLGDNVWQRPDAFLELANILVRNV